jgi:hypothetical protein
MARLKDMEEWRRGPAKHDGCGREYWWPILVKHLDEQPAPSSDLTVPANMAISIRRWDDTSGTTFDSESVVRGTERELRAEGGHNNDPTFVSTAWNDVQSVTFSYKCQE